MELDYVGVDVISTKGVLPWSIKDKTKITFIKEHCGYDIFVNMKALFFEMFVGAAPIRLISNLLK